MDWNCSDITYLNNLYWIATVIIKCVIATLAYRLKSSHLQIKFLEILIKCNFHKNFPGTVMNYLIIFY